MSSATKTTVTTKAPKEAAKIKRSPAEFVRQVKQEVSRVAWPTRKESTVSTIMVIILVIITSVFFLVSDMIISKVLGLILGL